MAVVRTVLASARRAGMPFGEAWAIGAEAALSYMTARKAREWWEALNEAERAWADAYAREGRVGWSGYSLASGSPAKQPSNAACRKDPM